MSDIFYLAYGSNINTARMEQRCPGAVYVGTAVLNDYRLLFKQSKSGAYLTVEKKKHRSVPLLVWKISEYDEQRLDRFEGCPDYYYKTLKRVEVYSIFDERPLGTVDGLIYILHEDRPLGVPTFRYYDICADGYDRFGFGGEVLDRAIEESLGRKAAKLWFCGYDDFTEKDRSEYSPEIYKKVLERLSHLCGSK